MNYSQHLSRFAVKLAALVFVAIALAACGKGYSNRAPGVSAADTYLTNGSGTMNGNARALTTTATLSAGSAVPASAVIGAGSAVSSGSSISSGLYSPQTVTLSCTDAAGNPCLATYYTIDGTTPTRASTVYSGPILLWSKTTVKYFSIDTVGNVEPVKTQSFLIGSIKIQDIKLFAAGWNHTLGIKKDGTLWAWGGNASGQLGDASGVDQTKPVQVGIDTNWAVIAAGKSYSLALKTDGTLWAWGLNGNGQLGDGTNVNKSAPVQIGTATNWSAIAAGDAFAMALKSDGTLWTWGANSKGQLGIGTAIDSNVPTQVGTATNWSSLAAGYDHAVALRNDGTVWTWGGNYSGQLAQGTILSSAIPGSMVPVRVPGNNYSAIAAGGSSQAYANELNLNATALDPTWVGGFTVALKSDGTLWAWGQNIFGQLGDGTSINMGWAGAGTYPLTGSVTFDAKLPIQIGTDKDWATISAGAGHTVALKNDGTLWSWGLNVNGQLANGNPGMNNMLPLPVGADRLLPYILPKHPWSAATAGGYQTVALRADGSLWEWGWNGSGQLGDGSKVSTGGSSNAATPTWRLPKFAFVVSDKVYPYAIDYNPGSGIGPGTGSGEIARALNGAGQAVSAVAAGTAPGAAVVDPSNQFLYVLDSAVSTVDGEQVSYIHTFSIDSATGALTEVGGATGVKTLYAPTQIKVDPLGKFVYVVGTHSKGWKAVAVYTINPATGEITCVGTGAKGAKTIEIEPQGRFAYTIRDVGVTGYSIDQRTGMLTSLVDTCQYTGCDDDEDNAEVYISGGLHLKADMSGQYLYLADSAPEIRVYSINQTNGKIYDTGFAQGEPGFASPLLISPGVGVDSHTQFMYLLFNSKLKGLALNQLSGQVTGVSLDMTTPALGFAPDPTGKLVYVFTTNHVEGFAIDPFSGKTQSIGSGVVLKALATEAGASGVSLKALVFASY